MASAKIYSVIIGVAVAVLVSVYLTQAPIETELTAV